MADNALPDPDNLVIPDDLSALLDGAIGTTDTPSQIGEHGVVSVIAAIDLAPASPYITEVQPTDDVAISLPYDKAVAYGMAVLSVAHRAHYLSAVLGQARDIVGGRRGRPAAHDDPDEVDATARMLLNSLMQDLPDIDDQVTAPLRFVPFLRRSDGRPMVRVSLPPHTEAITGWTFAEACDHAHAVLTQAVVSQLDTAYRTTISVDFHAGEQRGRAAVYDLANYFWDKPTSGGYSDPTGDDAPRRDQRPDPHKARPTGKGKKNKRR